MFVLELSLVVNVEAPFARKHLRHYLRRVELMTQRYMRVFAERLWDGQDAFHGGELIGRSEILRTLALDDENDVQARCTRFGIPSLAEIERQIAAHDTHLTSMLSDWMGGPALPMLPIEELRASFQLSELEVCALIVAAAPLLSVTHARLFNFAWADITHKRPWVGFLADMLGEDPAELFDRDARLVRYRLVVLHDVEAWSPATPLVHRGVEVPQRVLDVLLGKRLNNPALPGCTLHTNAISPGALIVDAEPRHRIEAALRSPKARLSLIGPQGVGRCTTFCALIGQSGQRVLEVTLADAMADLSRPAKSAEDAPQLVRLAEIVREARLHQAALLFNLDSLDENTGLGWLRAHSSQVRSLLEDVPGPLALSVTERGPLLHALLGDAPEVALRLPPTQGQHTLWRRALDVHLGEDASERLAKSLSATYRLTPGAIERAVESVSQGTRRTTPRFDLENLVHAIRRQIDHRLGWLAEPYAVELSLNEVVLTPEAREQIDEVLRYAQQSDTVYGKWGFGRHSPQGRGLSVMFSGPPGTGKTLTAGVLARELGRMLYRVDLSRIVDKYIGETEKNLAKVFDEAERAQAILLFDEADSLFAKRTSVKSSNDRYANLEVNFLLQRLESFDGVSILTTNFVASIDEAFQRRIRFKITFPMPGPQERAALWKRLLPPQAPVNERVHFEALGKAFEMSGGHIRNAVLRAAMTAAAHDEAIQHNMLWDAAVAESREMGNLVPEFADEGDWDE